VHAVAVIRSLLRQFLPEFANPLAAMR